MKLSSISLLLCLLTLTSLSQTPTPTPSPVQTEKTEKQKELEKRLKSIQQQQAAGLLRCSTRRPPMSIRLSLRKIGLLFLQWPAISTGSLMKNARANFSAWRATI